MPQVEKWSRARGPRLQGRESLLFNKVVRVRLIAKIKFKHALKGDEGTSKELGGRALKAAESL